MKVWLINPKTGALKHVPVSPHAHYVTLAVWTACGFGALALLLLARTRLPMIRTDAAIVGFIAGLVVRTIITMRNRGRALVARGWQFAEPASAEARMAAAQWQTPQASAARRAGAEQFTLDEGAFLAATVGREAPTARDLHTPQPIVQRTSEASIFMRFIMYAVAVIAFAVGVLCAAASRSDIQLSMSLTALIGSFILLGLGHIMGKIAR